MLVRTFTCAEHDEFSTKGWKPDWMKYSDPLEGMGAAHDILEHPPRMPLGAENEFMALGASLWIRGDTGYYMNRAPADSVAVEFPEILSRVMRGDETLKDPGTTRRLCDEYGYTEEWCQTAISKGVRMLREDFGYTRQELDNQLPIFYQERILGWMRRGIRYAYRRYRGRNSEVSWLFQGLEKELNRRLMGASEGDKVKLIINLKHFTFTAEEVYDERWY